MNTTTTATRVVNPLIRLRKERAGEIPVAPKPEPATSCDCEKCPIRALAKVSLPPCFRKEVVALGRANLASVSSTSMGSELVAPGNTSIASVSSTSD